MIALDTNALVRMLIEDDENQAKGSRKNNLADFALRFG